MSTSKTNSYKIAVIPGDGIGKEVMQATLNVLDNLDIDFEYVYGDAGDECLEKTGTALPAETLDIIRDADACLFGAAGETAADVIVKIRQEMKMFANLRPVKAYPNTNSLFDNIDFMIVRENTEGMYIADEESYTDDGAIARRIITKDAERRIIDYAFKYAKENNADILLATDPDCDRLGVAVKCDGNYVRMTGNQSAAVLLKYILSVKKENGTLPKNGVMFNTIVTSDLGDKVCEEYGVVTEKTLTGFKFIGDKIYQHETKGDLEFVFGYEESYGCLNSILVTNEVCDQASV